MTTTTPDAPVTEVVGYESDPLHALVYTSTPDTEFTDRDVTDLLFSARRANAVYGITGKLVLLEEEGRVARFLQLIEGPALGVEACFERILRDGRHRHVTVLFRGETHTRQFPAWDMAIESTTPALFPREVEALVPARAA